MRDPLSLRKVLAGASPPQCGVASPSYGGDESTRLGFLWLFLWYSFYSENSRSASMSLTRGDHATNTLRREGRYADFRALDFGGLARLSARQLSYRELGLRRGDAPHDRGGTAHRPSYAVAVSEFRPRARVAGHQRREQWHSLPRD